MSVKVENIVKYYGKQCVLDSVDFTLSSGEITGFLGPNGAGKTTMMNIITGYLQDWNGKVTIYGDDLRKNSLELRKSIGYLPEHNPIDEQLYVKEYLQYVASIYLARKNVNSAVREIIEHVGLENEQHKKIGQLSKGYKQRVGLAQALVHNPKLLVLDEPTTGLDPNQLQDIRTLIKEVSKEKTVLLSTHIMQEVEALCNRTLIINNGKLVNDSRKVNNPYLQTIRIIFSDVITNLKLPFECDIKTSDNQNFIIQSSVKKDIRPLLFDFAKENHLTLLHLAEEKTNIEQIFNELTKNK